MITEHRGDCVLSSSSTHRSRRHRKPSGMIPVPDDLYHSPEHVVDNTAPDSGSTKRADPAGVSTVPAQCPVQKVDEISTGSYVNPDRGIRPVTMDDVPVAETVAGCRWSEDGDINGTTSSTGRPAADLHC